MAKAKAKIIRNWKQATSYEFRNELIGLETEEKLGAIFLRSEERDAAIERKYYLDKLLAQYSEEYGDEMEAADAPVVKSSMAKKRKATEHKKASRKTKAKAVGKSAKVKTRKNHPFYIGEYKGGEYASHMPSNCYQCKAKDMISDKYWKRYETETAEELRDFYYGKDPVDLETETELTWDDLEMIEAKEEIEREILVRSAMETAPDAKFYIIHWFEYSWDDSIIVDDKETCINEAIKVLKRQNQYSIEIYTGEFVNHKLVKGKLIV